MPIGKTSPHLRASVSDFLKATYNLDIPRIRTLPPVCCALPEIQSGHSLANDIKRGPCLSGFDQMRPRLAQGPGSQGALTPCCCAARAGSQLVSLPAEPLPGCP